MAPSPQLLACCRIRAPPNHPLAPRGGDAWPNHHLSSDDLRRRMEQGAFSCCKAGLWAATLSAMAGSQCATSAGGGGGRWARALAVMHV